MCWFIFCLFVVVSCSTQGTPSDSRILIPNVDRIKLFAFRGKVNEEINGRESGRFTRDIRDPSSISADIHGDFNGGTFLNGVQIRDNNIDKIGLEPVVRTTQTQKPTTQQTPPVLPVGNGRNGCQASVTTVKGQSSCQGELIFDSNFVNFVENKNQLWTVQRKFATGPDYEFVIYEDNPKTLNVIGNNVIISPVLTDSVYGEGYVIRPEQGLDLGERCTSVEYSAECYQKSSGWHIIPPVISSQLTSKGKFSFKYGKVEVRAKLPKGDWMYPELFLNPESEEYGPTSNYESGQIRIAYVPGNTDGNNRLEGGVILGRQPAARKYAMKTFENYQSWTEEFHNFTILWTPDSITLSVDNFVYESIFPPEGGFSSLGSNLQLEHSERWKTGSKMAPFDKEMHIVVGVGVGGHNFEDSCDGTKPWNNNEGINQKKFYKARSSWLPTWGSDAKLEVDYVKVWALEA